MASRSSSSSGTASTRAPARGGGNPGALIILGVLLLGFALLIVTLQTQTNEAYINGTQQTDEVMQAQWTIWLQIPKLAFGDAVPGPAITTENINGIIVGQGIELVYISIVTSMGIAMATTRKLGRIMGAIAIVGLIAISLFDFYTDLVYGNVSPMAHFIFAVFCTFVIGFFPAWGLSLIEHGFKRI